MFKNLFGFLSADYDVPTTDFEKKFFADIRKFAFYKALNQKCQENTGKDIPAFKGTVPRCQDIQHHHGSRCHEDELRTRIQTGAVLRTDQ